VDFEIREMVEETSPINVAAAGDMTRYSLLDCWYPAAMLESPSHITTFSEYTLIDKASRGTVPEKGKV
jgi:hypothetical protein